MKIERKAFPVPWHESAYQYEVAENRLAYYHVLYVEEGDKPAKVIGYSGFWMMVDEAHISTIATDLKWRRKGLGGLLLLNLLLEAYTLDAALATLEVRASNSAAQTLYRDFGFEVVGGRKRYYQGREDAIIMTRDPLNREYRSFLGRKQDAIFKRIGTDIIKGKVAL